MHQRIMLSLYGLIIAMAVFSTHAGAVALGKIDVASHLGEPFYAEVPLTLEEGEVVSSVFVEMAAPADYRVLEVYRDQALNQVRADVERDSRGTRVELTSKNVIDAPFFNLVLKVRYGRATHYKKYPVFLDLPRASAPVKKATSLPAVTVDEAAAEAASPTVTAIEPMPADASIGDSTTEGRVTAFKPHDQWARTSHYGPMVYGDTISTVADRLRVDERYSRNQVMVALFEKNKSKFEKDNINLIQAGTHLDVPMADEVERIAPDQARQVIKDHNQRWRELVKQPRYAAVKEAQETRYSKRVRVGKAASGVATAPVSKPEGNEAQTVNDEASASAVTTAGEETGMSVEGKSAEVEQTSVLTASLTRLQKENEELQSKLAESDAKLAQLSAGGTAEAQATANARIKKLELQLARLQAELDSAKQNEPAGSLFDWVTYLLGGLVIVLLGGIAYLMRRERQHPAALAAGEADMPISFDEHVEPTMDDIPEIDVEPADDFSPDATEQMGTEEFEDAFTDSIPDLTEEETGEMEAFKDDQEDEPDPNVDYLSEADVYMRYGMEDEAEKQVKLALKLRESNKDAHVKLVQIRKSKGDDAGVDEALSTARMVLTGDALSNFDSTIVGMDEDGAGASTDEVNLDDTLPPGGLDVSDMESETPFGEAPEETPESGDLDDIDLSALEESDASEASSGEEDASLELGDIEWPEETPEEGESKSTDVEEKASVATEVSAEAVPEALESDGLDFDLSGLELPDEANKEPEATEAKDDSNTEVESSEEPIFDAVASVDEDDGLNLSDLDISDELIKSASDADSQVDALDELGTADLDKTVVMDWSKETVTSGAQNIGSESGAEEIDFSDDNSTLDGLEMEAPAAEESVTETVAAEETVVEAEPEAVEAEPEEHLSSVEFDLDDLEGLDVDLDESMDSSELDDFSSTIQTSIDEIKESVDSEEKAEKAKVDTIDLEVNETDLDDNIEFGLEPIDDEPEQTSEGEISAEGLGSNSLDELSRGASLEDLIDGSDKDFDATMELDSLLSELGDLDEPEADKKEDGDKEA